MGQIRSRNLISKDILEGYRNQMKLLILIIWLLMILWYLIQKEWGQTHTRRYREQGFFPLKASNGGTCEVHAQVQGVKVCMKVIKFEGWWRPQTQTQHGA